MTASGKLVMGIGVAGLGLLACLWLFAQTRPTEGGVTIAEPPIASEGVLEPRVLAVSAPEQSLDLAGAFTNESGDPGLGSTPPSGPSRQAIPEVSVGLPADTPVADTSAKHKREKAKATLHVRVVSKETGAALANVRLSIRRSDAHAEQSHVVSGQETTNEQGRAQFRVPAGPYKMKVSWGHRRESVELAGPVDAERWAQRIELVTADALFIEGVVLTTDGIPVAEAKVSSGGIQSSTDQEGRFQFGPVDPDQEYLLVSRKPGLVDSAPVEARAGEVGVEFRLERTGTLRVRAVDGSGNPLPGAQVTLIQRESNRAETYKREGDLFTWDGLEAATYSLVGRDGEWIGWMRVSVAEGSEESLTLVIAELAARIRVRCDDVSKEDTIFHARVLQGGAPVGDARWAVNETLLLRVPAGPCEVQLMAGANDWFWARSTIAIAGQETEVLFPPR